MRRLALLVLLVAACSSDTGTTALFAQNGSDFYELPFPNDLRRHDDGSLDLSRYPAPTALVDQYRMDAEKLDGFGLNGGIYLRFSDAIDETSLPDPAASMMPGASVYLINITTGERVPVIAHFRAERTNTIGPNRLAVRPYPGFGLDEGTQYALVVTNRVKDMSGAAVQATAELQSTLTTKQWYAGLLAWLDQPGDDERKDVVAAAVFTTQHATNVGLAIRNGVFGTAAPTASGITAGATTPSYKEYTGTYTAPNFQTGDVPYNTTGGEIQVGSDGAAIVQRMEPMRFALTVPTTPMPAAGYPICIYSHGTGGDYQSFISDGTGARLAAQGIATISTDQVLHGPRNPGGNPEVAFFNFINPYAGRDNALQGAADAWSQMRLALGMTPAAGVKFDPANVFFFGHSQGGVTGPAFIAFEPTLKGAVLSGTGGILYLSLLYKTAPVSFPELISPILRDDPLDEDTPSLALAQMWIERADGANYAKLMVRHPPAGNPAKNIFQTE
ncbi:MAG: hypothetical protein JO257_32950, partial [Deltaproteobacteria bacterium]|nr:hypothetical protein [Deltaproteobacteria bacterium]